MVYRNDLKQLEFDLASATGEAGCLVGAVCAALPALRRGPLADHALLGHCPPLDDLQGGHGSR